MTPMRRSAYSLCSARSNGSRLPVDSAAQQLKALRRTSGSGDDSAAAIAAALPGPRAANSASAAGDILGGNGSPAAAALPVGRKQLLESSKRRFAEPGSADLPAPAPQPGSAALRPMIVDWPDRRFARWRRGAPAHPRQRSLVAAGRRRRQRPGVTGRHDRLPATAGCSGCGSSPRAGRARRARIGLGFIAME